MDDTLGKMGKLLSDPESLQQLQELAQMLQAESGGDTLEPDVVGDQKSQAAEPSKEEDSGFPLEMLLRMQTLIGTLQQEDHDAQLLLALRPHLKTERQKKVDQAVKMLKLYAIFCAIRENGLLQDLI